jgi:hypothetical protein
MKIYLKQIEENLRIYTSQNEKERMRHKWKETERLVT